MPTGNGQPRTYDVDNPADVPAGAIKSQQLKQEINLDIGLVGNQLLDIVTRGNLAELYFTTPLILAESNAADNVVAAHVPVTAQSSFQFREENPIQSTQLETYQEALSFTTPPLVNGIYLIHWQAECRIVTTGPLNSAAQLRMVYDGTPKGLGFWPHEEWTTIGGIDRQRIFEAQTPTLTIEYRREPTVGGNDTVEVRRVKLGLALLDESV